jgi:hypothetical protein
MLEVDVATQATQAMCDAATMELAEVFNTNISSGAAASLVGGMSLRGQGQCLRPVR